MIKKRIPVVDGDVALVPLTQGQEALIDAVEAADIGRTLWNALWDKFTQSYYARGQPDGRYTSMARYLMDFPDGLVDHINGNTLDNRRENLRVVTPKQNQENRRGAPRNSTTGVRGVYFHENQAGTLYYQGEVKHFGKRYTKCFPRTSEGLEVASQWVLDKRLELYTHSDGR